MDHKISSLIQQFVSTNFKFLVFLSVLNYLIKNNEILFGNSFCTNSRGSSSVFNKPCSRYVFTIYYRKYFNMTLYVPLTVTTAGLSHSASVFTPAAVTSGSAVAKSVSMTAGHSTKQVFMNPSSSETVNSLESSSSSGLSTTAQLIGNLSRGSTEAGNSNGSTTAEETSTTAFCVTNSCDDNPCEHDGECIGLLFTNGTSDFLCLYAYGVRTFKYLLNRKLVFYYKMYTTNEYQIK